MQLSQILVDIAHREIGVREVGGNNAGPRVHEYQSTTWLQSGAWPWCAAWCCWVLCEALRSPTGAAYLSERRARPEQWRCRDASAFGWLKWASQRSLTLFDEIHPTLRPEPGDFVVFDFSHIGLVARLSTDPAVIHTIEGNVHGQSNQALRDSEIGDGVWGKCRNINLVRSFIRL